MPVPVVVVHVQLRFLLQGTPPPRRVDALEFEDRGTGRRDVMRPAGDQTQPGDVQKGLSQVVRQHAQPLLDIAYADAVQEVEGGAQGRAHR